MNIPLLSIVFSIAFTVIIGILMIIAFVTGFDKGVHIIGASVLGAIISIPVSFIIAKKISKLKGESATD